MESQSKIKLNLRSSIKDLNERGLIISSIWSSELLNCMKHVKLRERSHKRTILTSTPAKVQSNSFDVNDLSFNDHSINDDSILNNDDDNINDDDDCDDEDDNENDTYLLAKSYFDAREFERCNDVLKGCKHPRSIFLSLYAWYLVSSLNYNYYYFINKRIHVLGQRKTCTRTYRTDNG